MLKMQQQKGVKPEKDSLKDTTVPIFGLIEKNKENFKSILGNLIPAERFVKLAVTALRTNPKLLKCDTASIFGCLIESARFGLEINSPLQHSFMIPYDTSFKDVDGIWKKKTVAQFQIGYQGVIELFYRHPEAQTVEVVPVYEKDEFVYERGLNPVLKHIPADDYDETDEPIKYYCIARLKSGGYGASVMSKSQIMRHAKKYSKSYDKKYNNFRNGSAWKDNFEGMAMKTVALAALKFMPKRIDIPDLSIKEVDPKDFNQSFDPINMNNMTYLPEGEEIPENKEIPEHNTETGELNNNEESDL